MGRMGGSSDQGAELGRFKWM